MNEDLPGAAVVVIGSGIAGLVTALELAPRPVILLTAGALGRQSSSERAQGGLAAAMAPDDRPALHAADTVAAGDGLSDASLAQWLAEAAPGTVRRLSAQGVRFDRDPDGSFALGLEAAHARRRIVHAAGDGTGAEIVRVLSEAVRRTPSITVIEHAEARRLLLGRNRVTGVLVTCEGGAEAIPAAAVVLATGSIGGLYRDSTVPPGNWGRGLLMAAEAGAVLQDMEFVQFHPTALDAQRRPLPLVSEAVRGEGAVLRDDLGAPVTAGLAGGDLAPRDQVARAIAARLAQGRGVFLDASKVVGERFAVRFPAITQLCRAEGIDPSRQPIRVRPAVHYHMGGVAVDPNGRTGVPGLWACGEAACTGLHGANRLASNSLVEAAAMAARVAADIASGKHPGRASGCATDPGPADPEAVRGVMSDRVGLLRDAQGLAFAVRELLALVEAGGPAADPARLALMVAVAAHARRESRGAHCRLDHPLPKALPRHSRWTLPRALAAARRIADGTAGATSSFCGERARHDPAA